MPSHIKTPRPLTEVPDSVWKELEYEIFRAELEFADNYRAYRISDDFNKEEFKKSSSKGCCGFFETKIMDDAWDSWIVGCNYGH